MRVNDHSKRNKYCFLKLKGGQNMASYQVKLSGGGVDTTIT